MATIVPPTRDVDTPPALFDDDQYRVEQEPTEHLSPDQKRTVRQRRFIDGGHHPLLAAMLGTGPWSRLHPNAAPEVCSPKAPKGAPYTCGSCRFRQVLDWHSRSYPKCIFDVIMSGASSLDVSPRASHGSATDVRAWWPACRDYEPGDSGLSPDAARQMPETN